MAKIRIHGHDLIVKPLNKSRNRDIIELQVQSGLKMADIVERASVSDFFAQCAVSFLTQHNAGYTVRWDDLLDGDPESLGEFIAEAGDDQSDGAGKAVADPTQPEPTTGSATAEPVIEKVRE